MTFEFQIVGDGVSINFPIFFGQFAANFFPSRVDRFWGKNGRADIQPKGITLSGDTATITLWSVPRAGETITVVAEMT